MLRYIYANDLSDTKLPRAMFRDRATQSKPRLKWDVDVNAQGEERDDYDAMNPLYVIYQGADGGHLGSMRFLPTTGPCMTNNHFSHLMGGTITSPLIGETTRFCLSPDAGPKVAAGLMLAGGELMRGLGIQHFLGVFDARMVRIYRHIGSSPEVLGSEGTGIDKISVGLWDFTPEAQMRVAARAGISAEVSKHWFNRFFQNDNLFAEQLPTGPITAGALGCPHGRAGAIFT